MAHALKFVFVAAILLISFAPVDRELVFRGNVVSIRQGVTGNPLKDFLVTTRVEKVLFGSFSGKEFQFAVHAPAQSGLELGKQYTIRATRTETGYRVDELQWRRSAASISR